MKKVVIFLVLGLIVSCTSKQKQESKNSNIYESFAQIFHEIDTISDRDNGEFWNYSLKGPILLVDPETREIISNQNNNSEDFQLVKNVYIDTLPVEVNISNTALDWDGKRWTMLILPLPKEKKSRDNLIIHELFHRIQPQIGFENLSEQSNSHLDTYLGRLLLRLELEALIKAIHVTGKDCETHIANALRFRKERHTLNEIKQAENTLELNEGLAEYTGVMLSNRNSEEMKVHFKNRVEYFYDNKTFVRSFAYQTIPMYGYLLSQRKDNWHREITNQTNLTDYLESAFSINIVTTIPFETVAKENDYHFDKLQGEEKLREEERLKAIAKYKERFLVKPTLKLVFENMNMSFDPRNIVPLEEIGTVYPTLRVTDNWGILTVENGALLSADWQHVIVTEPIELSDSIVSGEGWKLVLKENWNVVQSNGVYELIKE